VASGRPPGGEGKKNLANRLEKPHITEQQAKGPSRRVDGTARSLPPMPSSLATFSDPA
jgi:hypothetical protein